jgi:hypothetical protein
MEHLVNSIYTLAQLLNYAASHGYDAEATRLQHYCELRDSKDPAVALERSQTSPGRGRPTTVGPLPVAVPHLRAH